MSMVFRPCTDHQVQVELLRLLYPMFVHVYLKLVGLGSLKEATQLYNQHRKRFSKEGASGAHPRAQVGRDPALA